MGNEIEVCLVDRDAEAKVKFKKKVDTPELKEAAMIKLIEKGIISSSNAQKIPTKD